MILNYGARLVSLECGPKAPWRERGVLGHVRRFCGQRDDFGVVGESGGDPGLELRRVAEVRFRAILELKPAKRGRQGLCLFTVGSVELHLFYKPLKGVRIPQTRDVDVRLVLCGFFRRHEENEFLRMAQFRRRCNPSHANPRERAHRRRQLRFRSLAAHTGGGGERCADIGLAL
ncbi:hypothetical protein M885DRAFT_512422 [Pelagophyceae sp. CCMP2097]|nr:hypothetical protein M885DRAFT_512422 [Pelagophyceae sp. CCMP2097]